MEIRERVEKEYTYLQNFLKRVPKSKVAIFEDGCLNYAIKRIEMDQRKEGIEIYLEDMRPRYISGEDLVSGYCKLAKDRKYNIVSFIRLR